VSTGDPLGGIRVVELSTGIGGGYAGKLFADAGADVVKVEPPGGDPLRRWSASGAELGDADGALFRYLAAGKRSIVGMPADAGVQRLVAGADLVVENLPEGLLPQAGLAGQPGLVVLSITPYGRNGSWAGRPATEFTVQAECGSIGGRGFPDRPPVQAGGRIAEWASGSYGAAAAVAAVRHAARSGRGAHIDVSMAEVMCICTNLFTDLMMSMLGRPPIPQPSRVVEFPSIEPTSDGWVGFNTNAAQMFQDFLVLIGRPDLCDIPNIRMDPSWRPRLEEAAHAWTRGLTTAEVIEQASLFRIPVAPVGNGRNLLEHEHLVARRMYDVAPTGDFSQPRPPYLLDGRRPGTGRPAPRLGEHAGLVGPRSRNAAGPTSPASDGGLPLAGLKVLDLTCWWAGPGSTQLLAALGADVIHVESIQVIDGMRPAATFAFTGRERWWEYSSFFLNINVNKRDLTLNLADPRGMDLAHGLIRWADLLVENYTPRVMENFGLGWDTVHRVNPRTVMVRMPAYGLDGPWRDRVGFAQTMEAMSGMAWVTGYADGPPMLPRGPCDPMGAAHAAFAMQVALAARERTGEGLLVEAPLIESALNASAEQVVEYTAYGALLGRDGNRSPGVAPQGVYPCRGEEQWLAVSVATDAQWDGLRRAVGDPAWAGDVALATLEGRVRAHDRIDEELARWSADQDLPDALGALLTHGVPAGAVTDFRSISTHPLLRERGFLERCDHPVVGAHEMFGMPFRYSGVERWIRSPAPTLGEHNAEVLSGILGLSPEELAGLVADGVIGDRPLGV